MMNAKLTAGGYQVDIQPEDSANDGVAITPSNTVDLATPVRAIYVGVSGDIAVVTPKGTVLTFKGVPQGSILPVVAARVNAAGTTATNLIGLF